MAKLASMADKPESACDLARAPGGRRLAALLTRDRGDAPRDPGGDLSPGRPAPVLSCPQRAVSCVDRKWLDSFENTKLLECCRIFSRGNAARFLVVIAFAGACLRARHTGFTFWDVYFVSCKTVQRTSERTNG